MNNSIVYGAWLLLLVAVLAWTLFGAIVWKVGNEREAYSALLSKISTEQSRDRSVARLHATVRNTKSERETLEALMRTDLVPSVALIERIGKDTGVRLTIDGATPVSADEVRSVSVAASGQGSLQKILKAVMLIEALPFPVVVESLVLGREKSEKAATDLWSVQVRIRLLSTTASSI